MATVRITDQLVTEVDYQTRQQFSTRRAPITAEYNALLGPSAELTEAIAATVRDTMSTQRADLDRVKPWLVYSSQTALNQLNGVDVPSMHRTFRFISPIPWPTNPQGNVLTELTSPRLARWATQLKDINARADALNAEETQFRGQVRELLRSCTTLRQALEIWPQLTSVMPRHYMQRHEQQADRRSASAPNPTIDIAKLNKSAVINTIANVNKDKVG